MTFSKMANNGDLIVVTNALDIEKGIATQGLSIPDMIVDARMADMPFLLKAGSFGNELLLATN